MAFNPTPTQQQAIEANGNVLVAAAAGSGKTAVLVERVIKKLISKDNPIPADKLLIVTFTNAAAAEMRSRIEKRLDEECEKQPENAAILLQKHLISSAKICTIDSFCIDLVRENFEILDVAPDFKIADSLSLRAIDEAVASNLFEKHLKSQNPIFFRLLDIIGTEYDEKNFINFILDIFGFSRQFPFPKIWFKSISDFYSNGKFTKDSVWYNYAFDVAKQTITQLISSLDYASELLSVSEMAIEKYQLLLLEAQKSLYELNANLELNDWDLFYDKINSFKLQSLPSSKALSEFPQIASFKTIYSNLSKGISKLNNIFYNNLEFINYQFSEIYEPICLLSEILIELDSEIFNEYKKNNSFTFHNTEHLALSLLCEEKDGNIVINPKIKDLTERFAEILVDEYQDTNNLQDLLFSVLSNNEKNLFIVGDVKQSIYAFRGANPKNFLDKKNRYQNFENANTKNSKKIILKNNFRCSEKACDFINYFFELFLNSETGDIIYNDEEKLVASAIYPDESLTIPEFHLINSGESEFDSSVAEAKYIAEYIKKTMHSGDIIRVDDNTLRPAKYSDFAILLRSARLKAPIIIEELKKQSIPVNFVAENYSENKEVAVFLTLLSVIDNPTLDIELLTVLMSPIFSFTTEEIAKIRADKKDGSLYSAIVFAKDKGYIKAVEFLGKIDEYKRISVILPLPEYILYLLNATDYLNIVSVMNNAEQRRANLLLLVEYAKQFSKDSFLSPFEFSKLILKHSALGMKSASITSNDAVKIMSIHASKGLQFPICIIAGIASNFNNNEAKSKSVYTTDFGIGFKYFDENLKTELTTVSRECILNRTKELSLEEELRLLYVAMTRTQDKLVFVSVLNNPYKKIGELSSLLTATNSTINSYMFSMTKSFSDWLLISLLLHPDGKNIIRDNSTNLLIKDTNSQISIYITDEKIFEENDITTNNNDFSCDLSLSNKIIENINFKYPYSEILSIESKASVSKLANSAENSKYSFSALPSFMNKDGIKPNERGTAMHKVMQFFDFSKWNDIDSEIERLYEFQYISEIEKDSLDIASIKKFFDSDIFVRMMKSADLRREMRFLTEIPVRTVAPNLSDEFQNENIIVQGAVDVCFVEDDGIVILDFKTDRVDTLQELADTYSEQLNIYSLAAQKIFNKPIKQKIIYSFNLNSEIVL